MCGAIFVPPIVNIINALTFMQVYRKYDNDYLISNYEKYNKKQKYIAALLMFNKNNDKCFVSFL